MIGGIILLIIGLCIIIEHMLKNIVAAG